MALLFSQDTKAEALGKAPLFAGLSRGERSELATVTEDMDVAEGKILCREGESAREFFVIVEGEVVVTKEGRELRRLGAGDFFGEIALVEHSPRTATVSASTPLRFFVLTSQAFWRLVDHQPEIERKILTALAQRLRATADDPTL